VQNYRCAQALPGHPKKIAAMKLLQSNKTYDPVRHQRRLFRWACFALVCTCIAIVSDYFRTPHLNASYNIGFNFGILFPLMIISTVTAYFVTGHTILGWKKMSNTRLKWANLTIGILVLVTMMLWFWDIMRVDQ